MEYSNIQTQSYQRVVCLMGISNCLSCRILLFEQFFIFLEARLLAASKVIIKYHQIDHSEYLGNGFLVLDLFFY